MKLPPILMLASVAFLLTACAASVPSGEGVRLDPPEVAALAPCALAVALPAGPVTQAQVEALWLRDRAALAACRSRHRLLAEWARGAVASFEPPP